MIIADFSRKKTCSRRIKYKSWKKSAIYEGDLEEHWGTWGTMDGKEPL